MLYLPYYQISLSTYFTFYKGTYLKKQGQSAPKCQLNKYCFGFDKYCCYTIDLQ